MTEICSQCGNEYESIGIHWSQNKTCSHPSLSERQKEVIKGLLMGDGYVCKANKTPSIECAMISKNYLDYVDKIFGKFSLGVSVKATPEEAAKRSRKSEFRPNGDKEDYKTIYRWMSMAHPEIKEFSEWYSTGEKVWPESIELTPTVLKHWYCGDGTYVNKKSSRHIQIAMLNEVNNRQKVNSMFRNSGLPAPSNYNISTKNGEKVTCGATFTVSQSKKLFDYMGDPLPDFEYKWPKKYR
jgi:hypothetical protein